MLVLRLLCWWLLVAAAVAVWCHVLQPLLHLQQGLAWLPLLLCRCVLLRPPPQASPADARG
jgi:hypothetical protein